MYLLAEIACIQVIIEITCLSKSFDCSNQMQGALLSYLLKILNTKFINVLMTQMATFLLLDITAYNNRFTLISIYSQGCNLLRL